MTAEKIDRRIVQTKMALKGSLVKLLKVKPINKISVKEICEAASVNRATFYAHYKSQHELLHEIEEDLLSDIESYLSSYETHGTQDSPSLLIERILEYVLKNADRFEIFLNPSGYIEFQQSLAKIVGEHFPMLHASKGMTRTDAIYVSQFLTSGSVGIIQKWLEDDMKKPIGELVELVRKLTTGSSSAFH